ncbi:hypothetical protein ANN_11219 [Periplaneta americana]|uniref:Transposase n=1 Tax=Periplaneta americana TaxID=6978 RepID=A0ABQ8T5P9_PERAM|nr:hypothetical protein ANN_11219 [Periplaneta americana]
MSSDDELKHSPLKWRSHTPLASNEENITESIENDYLEGGTCVLCDGICTNRGYCNNSETEHPHTIVEYEKDSPKVNVFCSISRYKLYGPFFFTERTVTGHTYLDMLTEWLIPQQEEGLPLPNAIFQQNGAPHYHHDVRMLDRPHRESGFDNTDLASEIT